MTAAAQAPDGLRRPGPLVWCSDYFGGAWQVSRHADVAALLHDARLSARRTGGWIKQAQRALGEMTRYFEARLREEDGQSAHWIGHIARAVRSGQLAHGPEALAQCALLLFASQETMRHLLGNAVHAALAQPGLWQRLLRAPQDIAAVIWCC